jgi:FKBP-type peptidyl-prolyl cis-trans isomerase (trigger factor)
MVAQELKKEQPLQEKMDDTGEEDVQVTEEQRKKHRNEAVRLLRQEFLLDQLATDLNIKVSEDELNAEINNLVKMLGETDAKKMKKEWAKSGVLLRLQSRIKRDKTLDTVMEKVQIKEEMVDRKDDIKDN